MLELEGVLFPLLESGYEGTTKRMECEMKFGSVSEQEGVEGRSVNERIVVWCRKCITKFLGYVRVEKGSPTAASSSLQETLSSAIGAVPDANMPATPPLMLILRGGASRLFFIPPLDPDPAAICPGGAAC